MKQGLPARASTKGMRRGLAVAMASLFGVAIAVVMLSVILYANLPTICGVGPEVWGRVAEVVLYAPTIWVTQPIDRALQLHGWFGAITLVSMVEIVLLATAYAWVFYHLLRRQLRARLSTFRSKPRRVLATLLVAGLLSVGARLEVRRLSFSREVGKPRVLPSANVRSPKPLRGRGIEVLETKMVNIAFGTSGASLVGTDGDPIVLEIRKTYEREPRFVAKGELVVSTAQFGAAPRVLKRFELPNEGPPSADARVGAGSGSDRSAVLPGGHGGEFSLLHPLNDRVGLKTVELYLNSGEALVAGTTTWLVGMGFGWQGAEKASRVETHRNPNQARQSLGVFALGAGGGRPELRGICPEFGDHASNNVDAVLREDGALFILGAEVVLSNGNSSRIHLFRFDTTAGKWSGVDTLFTRQAFTSEVHPKVVLSHGAAVALWNYTGGAQAYPDDGLWAMSPGESAACHLSNDSGDFYVLPDADNAGAVVVATTVGDTGKLRWFSRVGGEWSSLGETQVSAKIYTHQIGGTEPFVLFRGQDSSTVSALFVSEGGLVFQKLRLPPATP